MCICTGLLACTQQPLRRAHRYLSMHVRLIYKEEDGECGIELERLHMMGVRQHGIWFLDELLTATSSHTVTLSLVSR